MNPKKPKKRTDKSISVMTEIKNVTERINHITMTVKIDGTKKFSVETGSLVTKKPPDKK